MTLSDAREPDGLPVDLNGLRALVVDDSPDVAESAKLLLELLGADVIGTASTSAEADQLVSKIIPDFALVDFHLRDGALATGLIDRLNDRGVTVILCTGDVANPLIPKDSLAAVLRKPVDVGLLVAAVRSIPARR